MNEERFEQINNSYPSRFLFSDFAYINVKHILPLLQSIVSKLVYANNKCI